MNRFNDDFLDDNDSYDKFNELMGHDNFGDDYNDYHESDYDALRNSDFEDED